MHATLEDLIEQALVNRARAPAHRPRNDDRRSWTSDYGARSAGDKIQMDPQGFIAIGGRSVDDSSGTLRKDRLEPSDRGYIKTLWREVTSFCPGTKVLIASFGVVAFIFVI